MYFQTGQVFLSQNGQRGSLLIFYWLHSGLNKNTLCNGCSLTGWLVLVSESSCSQIKSKTIIDHKLLKDVHEESLQNSRQKQPVPVQPSRRAFEDVRTPRSVLQTNIEDVRTSEQHRPDDRSISIQQGVYFQKSTLFGKSLQAVRTISCSLEYFRVPFERGKDLAKTVRTLGQAVRT
jgi:hypothetical protein